MARAALLPQLQVFLVVARLKSFSGAARELGISPSAVSQAVRQLEEFTRVSLLVRTTRSVSLTDSGQRLFETAGPSVSQTLAALTEISAQPGESIGRVRLSVPSIAVPMVIEPLLPVFMKRHPRIELEIAVEDRFVDIVERGFDAGVRLAEAIERDMVQIRLTEAFRFVVGGSPAYFAKHGMPERPEDLLKHACVTFRSSAGVPYAFELERGKRNWRIPVKGQLVTGDPRLQRNFVEQGHGLAYFFEPRIQDAIRKGQIKLCLENYAPTVPGFFLYFPSRAQRSPALKLFVDTAKELAASGKIGRV
ncbi:MAG: LysR family transcriptional regulator [Archangium sp.]